MILNKKFVVLKKTESQDRGRLTTTYTASQTQYLGRHDPLDGEMVFNNGRKEWHRVDDFFCESFVPVEDGDRLKFGDVEYDVHSVVNVHDIGHHLELKIERIK